MTIIDVDSSCLIMPSLPRRAVDGIAEAVDGGSI